MKDFTQSPELRSLIEAAFDDAKSIQSRFPHQLLFALGDQKVQEVLDSRFRAGKVLKNVTAFPAQHDTGLIPICFTFGSSSSVQLINNCILVQLDHRTNVVAVDENFVPERPNPLVDSTAFKSQLPLAVASSQSRRLTRRIDPALTNQMRRLEADLIIRHGLLSNVDFEALGGETSVVLDTECTVTKKISTNTITLVQQTDADGNVIDSFLMNMEDNSEEQVMEADDSKETTINGVLVELGLPRI